MRGNEFHKIRNTDVRNPSKEGEEKRLQAKIGFLKLICFSQKMPRSQTRVRGE